MYLQAWCNYIKFFLISVDTNYFWRLGLRNIPSKYLDSFKYLCITEKNIYEYLYFKSNYDRMKHTN